MRLAFLISLCCVMTTPAIGQVRQGATTSSGLYAFSRSSTGNTTTPTPLNGPSYVAASQAARVLIADGRYAEANMMLSDDIAATADRDTRFLKGVSSLGVGDPATARRYFRTVVKMGHYRHIGATSGLAIAEIRLGNVDAAQDLLQNLRTQQKKCGGDCSRAKLLQQAIGAVEKALVA